MMRAVVAGLISLTLYGIRCLLYVTKSCDGGSKCTCARIIDAPRGAEAGRDRSAARTTLGGEFPARALSICEVGASFPHGPRFRRPPLRSRTVGFPQSGSDLGLPTVAFPY